MSTQMTIIERLLRDAVEGGDPREHVIESGSYLMQNVDRKFSEQFDQLVTEISAKCGRPAFGDGSGADGSKVPPPAWVTQQKPGASAYHRILKTTYWREGPNITWVQLRFEMDTKQRPTTYEILLGARKTIVKEKVVVAKTREHLGPRGIQAFWMWFKTLFQA